MDDSPQQRRLQRKLDRQERFPWFLLIKTFQTATSAQVLLVALVGAVATTAGWRLLDGWTLSAADKANHAQLNRDSQFFGKWPAQRSSAVYPCHCAWADAVMDDVGYPPDDVLLAMPYRMVAPAVGVLTFDGTTRPRLYYLLGGLWTLLVWAGFGCAIVRMAVRRLARDDRIYIAEVTPFAQQRLVSVVGGLLGPLAGVAVIAIPVALLGLVMRTDIGAALGGLLWLFVLPMGLLMSVILIGMLFGWPLIWGAVATESSDAFDAISRTYSYTFQRPLYYLGYALFAAVIGILGWGVVWLFSEIVINMGLWAAALGAGTDRMAEMVGEAGDASGPLRIGAALVGFWNAAIRAVASSYAYSFFWCATAGIYLLLRFHVDAVELDEVFIDEAAERYGLPELTPDDQGVPQADDSVS